MTRSFISAILGGIIIFVRRYLIDFIFPESSLLGGFFYWLLGTIGSLLIFWLCISFAWNLGSRTYGRRVTNYLGGILAVTSAFWCYFAVSGKVPEALNQALLIGWIVQICARIRLKKPVPTAKAQQISVEDVYVLVSRQLDEAFRIANTWPRSAVVEFASMVVNPDAHRGRLTEELKVERMLTSKTGRQAVHHSNIALDEKYSPGSSGDESKVKEPVYLPVLYPMKGQLYDGMKISVEGADSVESLSFHQSQVRYLAVIIVLFREAYDLPEEFNEWGEEFVTKFSTLVSKFMVPANLLLTVEQVEDCQSALEACFASSSKHPGAHASAKFMAQTCIERYAIILCVERQEWYDITYEYVLDTRQLLPPRSLKFSELSLKRAWRSLTAPAGFIVIPLSRAHTCSSFHLEMTIPSGSYIGATTVVNEDGSIEERSSYPAMLGQGPYVRLPTLGLSRAHLYLRSSRLFSSSVGHAREVRFNVYEKPYGSDLLAMLWLIVVVGISAVAKQTLLEGKGETSNILAFSIAFPLMLTTAVTVFTARAKNSLNVSVTAVALSFSGAALLVWEVSMFVGGLVTKDSAIRLRLLSDGLWTVLLAVGLCLALLASAIFVIRITRFGWFYMLCAYGSRKRILGDQPPGALEDPGDLDQGGERQYVDQ
ncbi:hypothetical protein QM797_16260 [Rhodococcus sp. IEGM 1381]|uniref:hypothetical protein n=1 Tax=Rhodococcus sp. IEGM 1381 TaxID=3047085 RepID=UPI0024B657D9|nr:hypothetical protein [Rhodococcus sp. IEGM 1381]MDI9896280.1 hypothetical protein [Rhodococcus sp. IEGM 1381]